MKKIFTILAFLISIYCNGQTNYFAINGQYNTNLTFRASNTYSAGDTIGIRVQWSGNTPSDTTKLFSFYLYSSDQSLQWYKDTVLTMPWYKLHKATHQIVFFTVPADCPISQNIQLAPTYNPDPQNNIYFSIAPSTTAVISPKELFELNIQINIYTTYGQFLKQVKSKDYKTQLNPGIYLFQSADEKYAYSGKLTVN